MANQDFDINIRVNADTTGAKQTEAELKAVSEQAYEIGRRLRLLAGAAIVSGGYEFVKQLKDAATNIEKISEELDKQGAQLVKNAQKHAEQSKFATTTADAIKLGESALKDVEATHERMINAAGEELSIWQKIADVWTSGFRAEGPIAATLRLKQEQTAQQFEMARQNAILDIQAAKTLEARRATQTYEETVKELNDRIKEQQALADTHWLQKDVASYLSAASAVEKYKKELEALNAVHEKSVQHTEKQIQSASPQVQRILQNMQAGFTGPAEILKRSATPGQLAELQQFLTKPTGPAGGRAAGVGESQELVDQIERNRINAERVQQGLPPLGAPGAPGAGGPGGGLNRDVVEAINRLADLWK